MRIAANALGASVATVPAVPVSASWPAGRVGLPDPEVIAAEIAEDLQAALDQFA